LDEWRRQDINAALEVAKKSRYKHKDENSVLINDVNINYLTFC